METLLKHYRAGMEIRDIAMVFELTEKSVCDLIKFYKKRTKIGRKLSDDFKREITARYINGISINKICSETGCSSWISIKNMIDEFKEEIELEIKRDDDIRQESYKEIMDELTEPLVRINWNSLSCCPECKSKNSFKLSERNRYCKDCDTEWMKNRFGYFFKVDWELVG